MEKYQDLIVTLIKNHRRYQGCESILDDIVREVMERAETVVSTVEDESIVTKYLTKIVSAAMITVPKEHNICPEVKKRTHTAPQAVYQPEPEPVGNQEDSETIINQEETTESFQIDENELIESLENSYEPEPENTAIYDSIKNSLSFGDNEPVEESEIYNEQEEIAAEEPETVEEPVEEDGFVTNFTSVTEAESFMSDDFNSEPELEEIAEPEPEPEPETDIPDEEPEELEAADNTAEAPEDEVDKELVDKMINGAEPAEESNRISERIEGLSAIYGGTDTEEIDTVFEEDDEPSEITDETNIETEPESVDITADDELTEIDFNITENTEEDSTLTALAEDDANIEEEFVSENSEVFEEETEDVENNADINYSDNVEETEEQFNPPNLSCFNFNADVSDDTDSSELAEAVKKYADKDKNIPVLKIWELKYCKNKSISEIASHLDIQKDVVLEVLAELVDLAKE